MTRRLMIAMGVCLAVGLLSAGPAAAQDKQKEKKKASASPLRVEGKVASIDKANKTVICPVRAKGNTHEVA